MMSRKDSVFIRLPPATAVLLLSTIFEVAHGYALPRQTKTIDYHQLNVVAWPPLPTTPPLSPFELFRRQEGNTICGYIGGNSDLPATCSAGSHCVLDNDHGAVGCCPNGETCTSGVYTGCVDVNSGPQTELNPYVYTCAGSDVCYRNEFAGGYYQYGCGTASNMGTTVETAVSGQSSLILEAVSDSFTATPTLLSEPTTINPSTLSIPFSSHAHTSPPWMTSSTTGTSSSPTASSSSSSSDTSSSTLSSTSSSSSQSSTTSTSTTSSSSSSSTSPSGTVPADSASTTKSSTPTAAVTGSGSKKNTGAIVGGTIGGIAGLALIGAALFFCWRRRYDNKREGPGPTPPAAPTTEYVSPMSSHGAAFAPLPTWQDEADAQPKTQATQYTQPYQSASNYNNYNNFAAFPYPSERQNNMMQMNMAGRPDPAPYPRYDPVHVAGGGMGMAPIAEEEGESPNAREIDDFSRSFSNALGQMHDSSDEDRQPLNPETVEESSSSSGSGNSYIRRHGDGGPLWQQNRRLQRNMMWM